MNPNHKVVLGCLVLTVVILGVVSYGLLNSTMEWNVEEDQTLTYMISVEGFERYFSGSNYTDSPTPYDHLNKSMLQVKIGNLPQVDKIFSITSFVTEVVDFSKTSIVSPFELENGTQNTESEVLFLNGIISKALMPIGGWSIIDGFFIDKPINEFLCDDYFSFTGQSVFIMGFRYFNIDAGHGWNATIDLSSGIPQTIHWFNVKYYGSNWYVYEITLESVS